MKIDESLTMKGYLKSLRPLVPGPITLEGNAKSEEKLRKSLKGHVMEEKQFNRKL